jgi:RHS repeat-associated protein
MDDPSTSGVTEGFDLMFYNARWYDPYLARFAQADSIVPAGVQGYDRYAYVNNNPINLTDPTGHEPCFLCTVGKSAIIGALSNTIRYAAKVLWSEDELTLREGVMVFSAGAIKSGIKALITPTAASEETTLSLSHSQITDGEVWNGTGATFGWRFTPADLVDIPGEPVLQFEGGETIKPYDLLPYLDVPVASTDAEIRVVTEVFEITTTTETFDQFGKKIKEASAVNTFEFDRVQEKRFGIWKDWDH